MLLVDFTEIQADPVTGADLFVSAEHDSPNRNQVAPGGSGRRDVDPDTAIVEAKTGDPQDPDREA